MGTYRFHLELPNEPEAGVLQKVLRLLGVLTPISTGEANEQCAPINENPAAADEANVSLLVGRDEAAALIGVSTSTLDRWRKRGVLPVVELPGAAPMFSREALRKFVDSNSRISSQSRRR